jgi:uncharacterized protein involved in exopolysaccharide biosynthesis
LAGRAGPGIAVGQGIAADVTAPAVACAARGAGELIPDPELRDYWAMVWRRKWWVVAAIITCVGAAAVYNNVVLRE